MVESLSEKLKRIIDMLREDGYHSGNAALGELEECRAIAEHIEAVSTRGKSW